MTETIDWTKTHPTEDKPLTWGFNTAILSAIREVQYPPKKIGQDPNQGPFFCFGSDIDFEPIFLSPLDANGTRSKFLAKLEEYRTQGGDSHWIQARHQEIAGFTPHYLAMLELHGLKGPDGTWLEKGELSDEVEYRYGPEMDGIGWHDEEHRLEIRTDKLEPLEFIAAYNKTVHALLERGTKIGHSHLHVSAWEGGRPFTKGARNIFENTAEIDSERTKSAVAALSYAMGNSAKATSSRQDAEGYVPIRVAKDRIELRSIMETPIDEHVALTVLKTMCNIRHGFTHPDAKHFPEVTLEWRPYFTLPDHERLQIALNQARMDEREDGKFKLGMILNLFELAKLDYKQPPRFDRPLCNVLQINVSRHEGGKVCVNVPDVHISEISADDPPFEAMGFNNARLQLEEILKDSDPQLITTFSTQGVKFAEWKSPAILFEENMAYQEFMPAALRMDIANVLNRHHGAAAIKQGISRV